MNFDIHGVKIKTDKQYLFPEYFLTHEDIEPDLVIERNSYNFFDKSLHEKLGLQFWGGNNRVYFESFGQYRHLQKILISDLFGQTTLSFHSYTNRHGIGSLIKTLFQFKLLQKGYTLVHGAGLEKEGKGILLSGWPRTGKSAVALRLAEKDDYNILGDDMVILSQDGKIYSFPKKAGVFYKSGYSSVLSKKERVILLLKYLGVTTLPPLHSIWDRSLRLDLRRFATIKDKVELKEVYILRKSKGKSKTRIDEKSASDKALAHIFNIFYHSPFAKRILLAYFLLNDQNPLYFEEKTKEILKNAFKQKNCYLLRNQEGNFGKYL